MDYSTMSAIATNSTMMVMDDSYKSASTVNSTASVASTSSHIVVESNTSNVNNQTEGVVITPLLVVLIALYVMLRFCK